MIFNLFRLNILLASFFLFISCNNDLKTTNQHHYQLVKVDSVQINIPIEFGLVFPEITDSHLLAYSYVDKHFHLLDSLGRLINSFDKMGEGPDEYSENLSFVTMYNGNLVFMDDKNLNFFSLEGEWIKSIPYLDPNFTRRGGIPNSELFFIDNENFIVPNHHIEILKRIPEHSAALDTMPIFIKYKYSKERQQFEPKKGGLIDTDNPIYSNNKFNTYGSKVLYDGDLVNVIHTLVPIIYSYDLSLSKSPIKKLNLNINDFSMPTGLKVETVTPDNYQQFNQIADINSNMIFAVRLDESNLFITYKTYRIDETGEGHKDYYGYVYNMISKEGFQIKLPKHQGHPSFWNKVAYLGNNKFLFVFENEIERDFYQGYVFELIKSEV